MKMRIGGATVGVLLLAAASSQAASADFELTAPDGRRVLLKDNGTWTYVEAKDKERAESKDNKDKKDSSDRKDGALLLSLERKTELGRNCRFGVQLVNKLPYEVRSLVLHFSAYRGNGVLYATESTGSQFGSLKPGNTQMRQVEFAGINCSDITRVQVVGGDRCTMGDLHRWADQSEFKGKCLAQVTVVQSDLVRFDK
jgi:hypothetical protein